MHNKTYSLHIFFSHFKPFKCVSTLSYISQSLFSSSLDVSSALWLKTHGLAARRLTIMDALAPTTVLHSTKYIPVLDKHVVSKVFDKVKFLYCLKARTKFDSVFKRFFKINLYECHNNIFCYCRLLMYTKFVMHV